MTAEVLFVWEVVKCLAGLVALVIVVILGYARFGNDVWLGVVVIAVALYMLILTRSYDLEIRGLRGDDA